MFPAFWIPFSGLVDFNDDMTWGDLTKFPSRRKATVDTFSNTHTHTPKKDTLNKYMHDLDDMWLQLTNNQTTNNKQLTPNN